MANSAWQFAWITMNTRLVIMWLRQGLEQGYSAVWSERRLGGGEVEAVIVPAWTHLHIS